MDSGGEISGAGDILVRLEPERNSYRLAFTGCSMWTSGYLAGLLAISALLLKLSARQTALLIGVAVLFGVFLALTIGFIWSKFSGRTSYVVDNEKVTAYRGDRVVREVLISQVKEIGFEDPTSWKQFLYAIPTPELPFLSVRLQNGETINFPNILIWGEEDHQDALRQLAWAIRTTSPLGSKLKVQG